LTTFDSYDEALSYLADSTDYMNMVKYSPGNRDALESVRIKRDILSRDAPSAKTGYGKCPKCGNADLLGTTQQLRGGDEGMALLLSCPIASCGFRAKR
jgi:DNA-directed RNA polymerase subunit M/transcription elongation factor TFIIS